MGEEKKGINWKKHLIGEWNWKRPIKLLLFAYGTLVVISLFFSERFMFPYRVSSYSDRVAGLHMLEADDGTKIATRLFKAPAEKYLVLHFHGNFEDIGSTDAIATMLEDSGLSVLAMDYRGYGLSEGSPTEENCYADAELVYEHALSLGYKPENIIIWGRSVGGGIAVELAHRKQVKALVLESTFCTAYRVATRVPLVPWDEFNNLEKIPTIDEPLFILHGAEDKTIAPWHTEKLIEAHLGKNQRHLIPNANHDDVWLQDLSKELTALEAFLGKPS